MDIYSEMLDEEGYSIREDAREKIRDYLREQRRRLENQFGNARECRRFCDVTVKAIAMRNLDYHGDEDGMDIVTLCDIDKAVGIAGNKEDSERQICYGFNTGGVADSAFML